MELLPDADGVLFRLPALDSVPWAQGERKTALGSLTALMASNSPAWYQGHCERGHPFRPDCDSCVRGRLRQRQAKRKEAAGKIRSLGYVMSADFTGKTEMDLDGHTVAIVCCVHGYTDEEPLAREAAYGFVSLLVKRDTNSVAEALDAFDNELAQLGRDKSRTIVRFHTDVDKSFLGKVKKMACRKGWSQTDTGGYRSQANGIVERRIGMLKQGVRTVLLAATGATYYYDQLWGHGLMYVNYCTNRNDWSDTLAPFTQLTGKVYEWDKEDHSFGELCIYHVPKENRLGQYQQPGELGLWMRKEQASSHSAVIVPIKWSPKQKAWILQKTVTSSTFKVYKGVYPLRMCPAEGAAPGDFEKWIDCTFDPLLHRADGREAAESGYETPDAADECSASESEGEEYQVETVLNSKLVKGRRFYLVKWKGYGRKDATWEPESALENCSELRQEYEDNLRAAEAYPALLQTLDTGPGRFKLDSDSDYESDADSVSLFSEVVVSEFKAYLASEGGVSAGSAVGAVEASAAVTELMAKQKVKGDVGDWVDGYLKEYNAVKDMRLRELGPEEAARVRAKVLVPRLRMILEAKRDGRKKGRLILQGFLEPYSWDGGLSSDSPVAYMSTIRCLLARGGRGDVVTSRDVSTAFLQSEGYGPDEDRRFVSFKTHKGADTRYYELLGPLYGQRSASRRWYETITKWLTAGKSKPGGDVVGEVTQGFGLIQGKNEPCLFRDEETGFTVVLYMDDILTRGSVEQTREFHEALGKRFACKDESFLADDNDLDFIGFSLTQETVEGEKHVYIDQESAMEILLDSFDRGTLQPKDNPMPTKYLMHSNSALIGENEASQYRHFVGTLNYFSRATRFDISQAVSRLSSKMSAPDVGAWKALVHLLGYLVQTTGFRIGGAIPEGDVFNFYVDSDHAGDRLSSSRSQTGYILFLNSFPVDWCSRKQPSTSVSPAEAEIYAMHEAVVACRLIQWVAEEMGMIVKWQFLINTDSSQAFSFQHNTCPTSKVRGCFDLRDKATIELRDKGIVNSRKIPRDLNIADMLTHCLTRGQFQHHLGRAQNLRNHNSKGACVFTLVYSLELCSQFENRNIITKNR